MSIKLDILAGRYRLEEQIARGGMGTVWKAHDEVLARPIAVKILHPHLSSDEAFLQRFRTEALSAARLAHPNIVAIYDSGSHEAEDGTEHHYIVMEYCDGGTLAQMLLQDGRLEPERVVEIGKAICDALGYAHGAGLVHRDIKPANVLWHHGMLKVADFGIAKAAFATSDITTTGAILGTVAYVAPEQARGEEPSARSDVYGLGILLYELLVGQPPFSGETQIATAMQHVNEQPTPLRSISARVPRALESVVMKSLAKAPEDRFENAESMRAALDHCGSERDRTTVITRPPVPMPAEDRPSGFDTGWLVRVLVLIGIAVVVAVMLAGVLREDDGEGDSNRFSGGGNGSAGGSAIQVEEVVAIDPYGSDGEHPEEAPLAADGDDATEWTTQDYQDSFEDYGKPGVGLVFDLGSTKEVTEVEVVSSLSGYSFELRAGATPGADENAFELVTSVEDADATAAPSFEPRSARYWLVWITSLPGGGAGSASIGEVSFFGP